MRVLVLGLLGYGLFVALLVEAGRRAASARSPDPGEVLLDASTDIEGTDIASTTWTRPEDYLKTNLMTDEPFDPY